MKSKVGGVEIEYCCKGCKGKVDKADKDEQINMVFGEKPFEKGFELASKDKDKAA